MKQSRTRTQRFAGIIKGLEDRLSSYYEFSSAHCATDFLVTREQIREHLGDAVTEDPQWDARASVWLQADGEDTFIGIVIDEAVREALLAGRNGMELDSKNLDAFCVVAEELSHFHVLIRHLQERSAISLLELETQAEIDKVVLAGRTLADAVGDAHLLPLARAVFDNAKITSANHHRYWEATRLAATMWFSLLKSEPHHRNILEKVEVTRFLQSVFYASGEKKRQLLTQPAVA